MTMPFGYDAWKLQGPPEMTAAEEVAAEAKDREDQEAFREAIAGVLADERREIYLATLREIVIEELNKLRPHPGEPLWQTATPVPIPKLG